MKKKFFGIFVTMICIVLVASSVLAAGSPPGSGWWSGEVIQNVSGTAANVSIQAFDANGASTYSTTSVSVPSGGNKAFLPSDFAALPATFSGSGVVTADQDIRGIVNLTNRPVASWGVAGGLAAGQYQASGTGSTSLRFPLMKNNFNNKTTTFYLQNAGDTAATITATFYDATSSYVYTSGLVEPYRMIAISPLDTSPAVPAAALGSMVATSAQPLVGVVLEHFTVDNPASLLQATRGFASTEAFTTYYVPVVKYNFNNRFTGISVQNTTAGNIDITVTYKSSTAACNNVSDGPVTVQPNKSYNFVHLSGQPTVLNTSCLASATVVATGNVVAIVNESYTPTYMSANPTKKQESTTYSAFSAAAATTKVVIPLYKENAGNKTTGLTIQNVGAVAATNVVAVFVGPLGTFTTKPQTIAAGGSLTLLEVSATKNAALWNGTVMPICSTSCATNSLYGVTITADQPIVAIANESVYPFSGAPITQDKNNYEGFNMP